MQTHKAELNMVVYTFCCYCALGIYTQKGVSKTDYRGFKEMNLNRFNMLTSDWLKKQRILHCD